MNTSFSIDYEWFPANHGDESERWTLAELAINVGSWCGTEVEDVLAKTVRNSARLSALHLAEWFAANWWRLLWEPRSETLAWRVSHKMGNAGHGFIWPDLSFSSDWQSVHVSSRPTALWEAEPIRYLNDFDQFVSIRDFEAGVGNFIDGTIARLSSIQTSRTNLSLLWNEVARERSDPESSEVRMLEACMGYDPDQAPHALLYTLTTAHGVFRWESYSRDGYRLQGSSHRPFDGSSGQCEPKRCPRASTTMRLHPGPDHRGRRSLGYALAACGTGRQDSTRSLGLVTSNTDD